MNIHFSRPRIGTILCTFIVWFGVLLQFLLSLHNSVASGKGIIEGIVIYFGFFTVLTNIFVALALSVPLVTPTSSLGRFFAGPNVASTAAAAITVVGVAYFILLRNVWDPQGWQLIADIVLHYVTPVLFLIYWWFVVPKENLKWSGILIWILYPIGYSIYVFIRGALTGLYPYYFIDVSVLGYLPATINAAGVLLGFAVVAAMLVAAGRFKESKMSF